jgi:hypothetical protein
MSVAAMLVALAFGWLGATRNTPKDSVNAFFS